MRNQDNRICLSDLLQSHVLLDQIEWHDFLIELNSDFPYSVRAATH